MLSFFSTDNQLAQHILFAIDLVEIANNIYIYIYIEQVKERGLLPITAESQSLHHFRVYTQKPHESFNDWCRISKCFYTRIHLAAPTNGIGRSLREGGGCLLSLSLSFALKALLHKETNTLLRIIHFTLLVNIYVHKVDIRLPQRHHRLRRPSRANTSKVRIWPESYQRLAHTDDFLTYYKSALRSGPLKNMSIALISRQLAMM